MLTVLLISMVVVLVTMLSTTRLKVQMTGTTCTISGALETVHLSTQFLARKRR